MLPSLQHPQLSIRKLRTVNRSRRVMFRTSGVYGSGNAVLLAPQQQESRDIYTYIYAYCICTEYCVNFA